MAQTLQESGGTIFGVRDNAVHGGQPHAEVVTADKTLTIHEANKTVIAAAVDLVITLPPTQKGLEFHFIVDTVSATTGLSISPAAADKFMGHNLTEADDKDLINTAATDALGDSVSIVGDGVDGWHITRIVGTWAREA